VIELSPHDIDLGERAGRDPGDLCPLMDSLETEGMAHPVTVTPGYRLVTGRRRLEACRKLGRAVPAEVITTIAGALEHLARENADGRCAKPMTVNGSQYIRARGIFTAARGYKETFGKRRPVSDRTRQQARAALEDMTSPEMIVAAYRRFRTEPLDLRDRQPSAPRRNRAIESAVAALTGLTDGLRGAMPVVPGISDKDATRWDNDITAAMKILRTFRNQLRETAHER
jgi:hypothetical protein